MTIPLWLAYTLCVAIPLAALVRFGLVALRIARRPRQYYLVGRYKGGKPPRVAWDMVGVFRSRPLALAACADRRHFIVAFALDTPIPEDGAAVPRIEYPLAEGDK